METQLTTQFRQIIASRIDAVTAQVGETVASMSEGTGAFPDPSDRAALEADRAVLLGVRDRERKLLQKLRKAMERLDSGTYGVCEDCGCFIGTERLMARPEATLCIECKQEREAMEARERMRRAR